jgi:hypothetical protein
MPKPAPDPYGVARPSATRALRRVLYGRAPTSPAGCTEPPPGRVPTVAAHDAGRGARSSIRNRAVPFAKCVRDGSFDAGGSGERLDGGQPGTIGRVFLEALHSSSPRLGASAQPFSSPGALTCTLPGMRRASYAAAACHALYGCSLPSSTSAAGARCSRGSCGSSPLLRAATIQNAGVETRTQRRARRTKPLCWV